VRATEGDLDQQAARDFLDKKQKRDEPLSANLAVKANFASA
jgi:hypothetical protein